MASKIFEITKSIKEQYTNAVEDKFKKFLVANQQLQYAFRIEAYSYRCLDLSKNLYTTVISFIKEFKKLIKKWEGYTPKNEFEEKISQRIADDIIKKISLVYMNMFVNQQSVTVVKNMDRQLKQKILNGNEIFDELGEHLLQLDKIAKRVMKNEV